MKNLFVSSLKSRLCGIVVSCRQILNQKGFSTQDVATGLTMAVLVGTVAIIAAGSVLMDTEERVHVFNAQTMAEAAKRQITETQVGPDLGETVIYTLQSLYEADKLEPIIDASSDERFGYDPIQSFVLVENVLRTDTETNVSRYKFYVRLSNIDNTYVYLDETDPNDPERINTIDLTRDHVLIPKRDREGVTAFAETTP